VNTTSDNKEQANHDGTQAGSVAVVVVVGALPQREAIGEEMIISVALGSAQDVGDQRQTGLSLTGLLNGGLDLSRSGRLDGSTSLLVLAGLGAHLLLDLVGVQRARLLAVGLGDVVERGRRGDAEDVVKGRGGIGLEARDFIANAKDFAICRILESLMQRV
jgi:hypothetical protein